MEFYTIASSSAGNVALVREGDTCLLIDAGITCRRIERALSALGLRLSSLSGILITHGHGDHVRGLGTLQKHCFAPLYASFPAVATFPYENHLLRPFLIGEPFTIGSLRVLPFRTSHDSPGSVGYRIDSASASVATLTDTGFVTPDALSAACGADLLLLEANHDPAMLLAGRYPLHIKHRIQGNWGHLSNDAAAAFAVESVRAGTSEILLAHLSAETNTPQLAHDTVARALEQQGLSARLSVAPRESICEVHVCRRSPSFASES